MKRLVVLLLLTGMIASCGDGNIQDRLMEDFTAGTQFDMPSPEIQFASGVNSDFDDTIMDNLPEDQRVWNENMMITFNWTSLEEIQAKAAQAGQPNNGADIYGMAYPMGNVCYIYAQVPHGYDDYFRLYIIGHELLHCWGWPEHD
jgi:hypothetical protein